MPHHAVKSRVSQFRGIMASPSLGRALSLILLVWVAASCSDVPDRQRAAGAGEVQPPPADLVSGRQALFDAAETKASLESLMHCSGAAMEGVTDVWSPSPQAVSRIVSQLPGLLDTALERVFRGDPGRPRSDEYYTQYMGVVRNGERLVYVNGFHESHLAEMREIIGALAKRGDTVSYSPDEWVSRAVSVCDAGTRQFYTFYDPRTGAIAPIRFSDRLTGPVPD